MTDTQRVTFMQVIYSDFRKLASQGHVKHVQIDESSGQIFFDAVFSQQKQAPKKSWIPGRRSKASQQPAGLIKLSNLLTSAQDYCDFLI